MGEWEGERRYGRELGLHRDIFEGVERGEVRNVVDTEHMGKIQELLVQLVQIQVFAVVLFARENLLQIDGLDSHLALSKTINSTGFSSMPGKRLWYCWISSSVL